MAKWLPGCSVIKGFRGNQNLVWGHLFTQLVIAFFFVAQRFGLSKPARVCIAKREESFPVCKDPVEAMIGKGMDGITFSTSLPDFMKSQNSLSYTASDVRCPKSWT